MLAVPHPSVAEIVATRGAELAGKIVVDITNPLNFETFDSLVVPADGSKAGELAAALPDSRVLKAFNTNFAATLAPKTVGSEPTTVLIAGDDVDAKDALAEVVRAGGVAAVDAGSLAAPVSSRPSASCSSPSRCRRRSAGRAASRSSRSRSGGAPKVPQLRSNGCLGCDFAPRHPCRRRRGR